MYRLEGLGLIPPLYEKLNRMSYQLCRLAGRPPLPDTEPNPGTPEGSSEGSSEGTVNLDFRQFPMDVLHDVVMFYGIEEVSLSQYRGNQQGLADAISSYFKKRLRREEQRKKARLARRRQNNGGGTSTREGSSGSSSKKEKKKQQQQQVKGISIGDRGRKAKQASNGIVPRTQEHAPPPGCCGGEQPRVSRKRKAEPDASAYLACNKEAVMDLDESGEGGGISSGSVPASHSYRGNHGYCKSTSRGSTSEGAATNCSVRKPRRPRTTAKDPSAPAYVDMISEAFSGLQKTQATQHELCDVIEQRYCRLLVNDCDPYEKCPKWKTCVRKVLQSNQRFRVEGARGGLRLYSVA